MGQDEVQHRVSAERSRNMAAIKGKDTKPEIIVRRFLWSRGFRYRLNHHRLPGRPDIVMRKYRTCIFVNGCFWHGHRIDDEVIGDELSVIGRTEVHHKDVKDIESSECCKIPKTNRVFWVSKILRNKERDILVQRRLAQMGWHCITVWECELKKAVREQTLESLAFTLNEIYLQDHSLRKPQTYCLPEEEQQLVAEELPPGADGILENREG